MGTSKFYSRALLTFLLVMTVMCCLIPGRAQALDTSPELSEAQSAIIVDSQGKVLWSKNPDVELPEASITKIMTAMVALDSGVPMDTVCNLTDVELSGNAQAAGFAGGQTATFYDLMRAMLVYSANDAAVEVARQVSGNEDAFVELMNAKAAELGMTHTHFVNPHGLDADGHYSTVSDLVIMGRYAMTHYPFIAKMVRTRSITLAVGGVEETLDSTDDLMDTYEGLLGIKTGAGDTGTTFLGCARRDNTTLYTCVLGCQTHAGRFSDTESMLNWAYGTYDRYALARKNTCIRFAPFAFYFGFSCAVTADSNVYGLLWPEGGATNYSMISLPENTLLVPGETCASEIWKQNDRIVAACSYSAKNGLVKTSSFGPFTSLMFTNLSTVL